MSQIEESLKAARQILKSLGLPKQQQNKRSALCLLALLNLHPGQPWSEAECPLMGITPIITWIRENYGQDYAPNTRETIRRQTLHQFRDAGIVLYNPDQPDRPVNSPKAVYQIEPNLLGLLQTFDTPKWDKNLKRYLGDRETLISRYNKDRQQHQIPVEVASGETITLSSGDHSQLIRAIIEEFAPRFAPGSILIYVGDTGNKWRYFNQALLTQLGVTIDIHGKMPDVVLHYRQKKLATTG